MRCNSEHWRNRALTGDGQKCVLSLVRQVGERKIPAGHVWAMTESKKKRRRMVKWGGKE